MITNIYFENQMKELLKEDYEQFIASFHNPIHKALRINPLKASLEQIRQEISLGELTPFDGDTYYIGDDEKLGKHPYHLAGLYYLQEPSATMVVNALDIQPDDWVLDLCAAPGGKSTQILSKLKGTGFLWSNEYDHNRAMTLLSNLERWSGGPYIVTNNTVEQLCPMLEGVFDKVVIDAPCSGAAMFKKYPETVQEYNANSVAACVRRQLNILDQGCRCVKENGVLVYSTCTYNRQENEDVLAAFLAEHADFELVDTGLHCGVSGFDERGLTRRVFPYQGGEGHFVARLVRHGSTSRTRIKTLPFSRHQLVDQFIAENLKQPCRYTVIRDHVYVSDMPLIDTRANVIRQGTLLGDLVKGRLEPHHHFFISCREIKKVCELTDSDQLSQFLSGNALNIKGYKGFVQITYHQVPIGFGKGDGNQIKNRLPKGLRIL